VEGLNATLLGVAGKAAVESAERQESIKRIMGPYDLNE